MYYKIPILAVLLAVSLSACATAPVNSGLSMQFEQRLATQQEELNAANSRIDELSIKVLLLQEKIGAGATRTRAVVAPDEPPKGLAVVELKNTDQPDVVLKAEPAPVLSLKLNENGIGKAVKKRQAAIRVKKASVKRSVQRHAKGATTKQIEPKGLYATGQNLFLDGRYADARAAFRLFIDTYPKHSLADNALYWIGEAYYSEKQYDLAIKSFLKIADFYPNENKAPNALLKAGYTYIEIEDYVSASRLLKRLVSSYPGSVAAAKADRTLRTLLSHKKEGPK